MGFGFEAAIPSTDVGINIRLEFVPLPGMAVEPMVADKEADLIVQVERDVYGWRKLDTQ